MSSQLVDLDGDGHKDILAGSYSGSPYWIKGSADGFGTPEKVVDKDGEPVLIAAFWSEEESKWYDTDKGHCTSAAAVDWNDDGVFDLLLGDYREGKLFLRLNEGTAKEPKFAATNTPVEAGGEPLTIEKGLAAPRIVDWNGDGKFDILCGGTKGGVYLFANEGETGKPRFAAAETLIEPLPGNDFIKKVPTYFGEPTQPGSSFHIEPTDYDGDGDLDLLVGARSSWNKENLPQLTEEEQQRLEQVSAELAKVEEELQAMMKTAKTREEQTEISKSDEFKAVITRFREISKEKRDFKRDPTEQGDFVWLFRRK